MRVGTPSFVGSRLREAREARGLTCQALALQLGVARSSVTNYENGVQTPSPAILQQLSESLRLPAHFFTRKIAPHDRAALFFRSFHSATKQSRTIASRKYEWFREIAAFIHQFVKFPEVDVPDCGSQVGYERLSLEDVEHIASEVRIHWNLGDRPISNVVWLIENKGMVCCRFQFDSPSLDGFSEWRNTRPFVALASDKRCCVRSRYDAAHELAHMVLHRVVLQEQLGIYSRFSLIERQADTFAAAFLLPASSFIDDFIPSLDGLRDLKRKWQVSIASMIMRGRQLNLLSDLQEKNLWRQIGRRKWRTREPLDDVLPVEEPEYVRRSITLLEKRGLSSVRDIAFQLGISEVDVVRLCGIQERMEIRLAAEEHHDIADHEEEQNDTIPFSTDAERLTKEN
jgi:Zn-dependent peptidase ImmA (M78 family)/transcriptional regulator with XRE-family HTH domain